MTADRIAELEAKLAHYEQAAKDLPEEPQAYISGGNYFVPVAYWEYSTKLRDCAVALAAKLDSALLDVEGYKAGEGCQSQRAETAEAALATARQQERERVRVACDDLNSCIPVPTEPAEYGAAFVDGYEQALDQVDATIRALTNEEEK